MALEVGEPAATSDIEEKRFNTVRQLKLEIQLSDRKAGQDH